MVYIFQTQSERKLLRANSHKERRMFPKMIVPTLTVVILLTLVLTVLIQRV